MEVQRSVYASNYFFSNLLMFIFTLCSFVTNDVKKKTVFPGNMNVKVNFLEKEMLQQKMLQYIYLVLGEKQIRENNND